jgi:oligopeptidase A
MQITNRGQQLYPNFTLDYENVLQDLNAKLDAARHLLKAMLTLPHQYATTLEPWIASQDELSRFWAVIHHLNNVSNEPKLKKIFPEALRLLTDFQTEISHNSDLYRAMQTILEKQLDTLDFAQKKWLELECKNFELAGVALNEDKKRIFASLVNEESQTAEKFEQNVLAATDEWHLLLADQHQLSGLPESVLAEAGAHAESLGETGWALTLHAPCYNAVMKYAKDMSVRRKMHSAFVSRASTKDGHDNGPYITKILEARDAQAKLLGFSDYCHYSLADKMANSVQDIEHFLVTLVERARPLAEQEWQDLKTFAEEQGLNHIQPWDTAYLSERLRQKKHTIHTRKIQEHFQLPRVLSGLMTVVQRVFNIRFSEVAVGIDTWHPSVQVFSFVDQHGQPKGTIFFDLFARPGKRSGAWMDVGQQRRLLPNGDIQIPMAFVICNFSSPSGGRPSLLTHQDVLTLFHEVGHALHHVLSDINVPGVSGVAGVPWDVVEFPSQLFEHWAWQPEVIKMLSCHVETGASLSDEQIDCLIETRNFQTGLQVMRQVSYALFDLMIHHSPRAMDAASVQAVLSHLRQQYWLTPVMDFDRFQNSFTHIFSGGYAAGYYSYLWAELLSSDIFSRFEEDGIWNKDVGQELLTHLLGKGGACDIQEGFKAFRGRAPNIDALCRHLGLPHA